METFYNALSTRLLTLLICCATLGTLAQSPRGFEQKRASNHVSDAKIKGFSTIDGSKSKANKYLFEKINLNKVPNEKIVRDTVSQQVIFIENLSPATSRKQLRISAQQMASNFIDMHAAELRLTQPAKELKLSSTETEGGMTHLRMQQNFGGLSVYGGEIIVHLKDDRVTSLNGKTFPTPNISTVPAFDGKAALLIALRDVGNNANIEVNAAMSEQLELQKNVSELIIYHQNGEAVLTYELTVRPNLLERWVYFVNAVTGEVIDKYNYTCTLDGTFRTSARDLNGRTQEFRIYEKSGTYYMLDATQQMFSAPKSQLPDKPTGVIWTIDAKNSRIDGDIQLSHVTSKDGLTWSPVAVSAQHNAGICYDYYLKTFNRNSLNGNGGNIVSVINITDEDGSGLDNAYWNGEFMGYGNGNQGFKPLAGALDVAGHEMTHGVIENTARLEYRNQSGALNESFADIFGVLIDRDDWTLGEDIVKPGVFPTGALRSLADPNQGGTSIRNRGYQPKTMSQYVFLKDTPDEYNGGVHVNSGITNHAFYQFARNGSVGLDKAEKVYYQVLTNYLTRTSKFIDLRLAVIDASKNLYGDAVANVARQAFDAVGIVESGNNQPPVDKTPELPVNPGAESLVVYDPNEEALYYGVFGNNQYVPFAKNIGCLNKPSVTDDGSFVYFVGKDKNIYRKDLRSTAVAQRLSDNGSFRNVAVSKDGKRLAALAATNDKYIYIFDLENDKNVRFLLYNSTYTQGITTGEVLYADSFEWDYSGEFLIYDAFNRATSVFGNVEFWDVGILQAWDVNGKKFGTGNIEKVFTNLERDDNIGNPGLSKTSPNVLAFDFYNAEEDAYYILTADFDKGTTKRIVKNNDIGYPDYSKSDDKLVFNSLNGSQKIVRGVNLAKDKITPTNNPQTLFTDAKWAIWYAQGQRQLPTKTTQTLAFTAINDMQPGASVNLTASASSNLPVQFNIKSGTATLNGLRLTAGSTPGKVTVEAFQIGNQQFTSATIEQSFCIIPSAPVISQNGTTLTVQGGTNFQWYLNGQLIGGQTAKPSLQADLAGTYTARSITTDGCLSGFSNSIMLQPLGTENINNELTIFPNPSDDFLEISVPANLLVKKLKCFDATGREIFEADFQRIIPISKLVRGTYTLKLITQKEDFNLRFIKK